MLLDIFKQMLLRTRSQTLKKQSVPEMLQQQIFNKRECLPPLTS